MKFKKQYLRVLFIISIFGGSYISSESGLETNFDMIRKAPSLDHLFGTDWLGRDLMVRTLKALVNGLKIGFVTGILSTCVALMMSSLGLYLGKKIDTIISFFTDIMLSLPQIIFMIIISYLFGGGVFGIILAIGLTHWIGLSRVIRVEMIKIRKSNYIQMSHRWGRSSFWILRHHFFPHLLSHLISGISILIPQAIIHETTLTFLGLGTSEETPTMGNLLHESLREMSRECWWAGIIPGIMLFLTIFCLNQMGEDLRKLYARN